MTAWLITTLCLVAAPSGSGNVTYVTDKEAFLNVGTEDGLGPGATVEVVRRGRSVGKCQVSSLSAKRALCKSDRVQNGDRFIFAPVAPPPKPPPATPPTDPSKVRPVLPDEKELARKRAMVQAVPIGKVGFKGRRDPNAMRFAVRGSVTARQQAWATSVTRDGTFGRSSLDANTFTGLRVPGLPHVFSTAALRVTGDLLAPENQRGRPGEFLELYVWGASVGVDDGPVVGELGRFLAHKAPGLPVIDGAQVGWVTLGGSTEVGAYAGAIPDLLTTAPSAGRLTTGLYFGVDVNPTRELYILPRGRIGITTTPDFARQRAELEVATQLLWLEVGSLGGSVRVGALGDGAAQPSLDAAHLDASFTWVRALRLDVGYRYLAPLVVDLDDLTGAPKVPGAHHGSVDGGYEVFPWLVVGGLTGAGFELGTDTFRAYVGPRVGLPRAFGDWGGMELGYVEEFGEWPGRSGWVGMNVMPVSVLRLGARFSYFESEAPQDWLRDAGVMLLMDAPVLPWLSFEARGYAQQTLPLLGEAPRANPTAMMLNLGVTGSL